MSNALPTHLVKSGLPRTIWWRTLSSHSSPNQWRRQQASLAIFLKTSTSGSGRALVKTTRILGSSFAA